MIEVHLDGGIYELNFGYDTKMEGYTNSILDILKLSAILRNESMIYFCSSSEVSYDKYGTL
jgi:hypothetical protein